MNGASKILTVSYGTFSCTLEGFDDPFNTMRAIAEYFRDLAADDRYFGAEPPTPDAAMLHRIAEREVSRRVEARVQDNAVILRTGDAMTPGYAEAVPPSRPLPPPVARMADAPDAPALPGHAAADLPSDRAMEAPSPAGAEPDQLSLAPFAPDLPEAAPAEDEGPRALAEDDAEPDRAPAPSSGVTASRRAVREVPALDRTTMSPIESVTPGLRRIPGGVAARLQRARAAIEQEPGAWRDPVAPAPVAVAPMPQADSAEKVAQDDAPTRAFSGKTRRDADADDRLDALPLTPDLPTTPMPLQRTAATAEGDDAFLAGLSALISAPAIAEPPIADPDAADAVQAALTADETLTEGMQSGPVDLAPAQGLDSDADDTDDLDGFLASLDDDAPLPEAFATMAAPPLAPATYGVPRADAPKEPVAEAVAAEVPDARSAPLAAPSDLLPEPEPESGPEPESALESGPLSEKAQRARARVIRIRRGDAPDAPEARDPAIATLLSPEREAELAAELAALRSDAPPPADHRADPPADHPDTGRPDADPRRNLETATGDESVTRLIAQTNTALQGPESRRRLSAIAHLKAAVAATVADRRSGSAPAPTDAARIDPYRDDLERVVRPRRPSGEAGEMQRPAPLVLVSAQRIDRPAAPAPAPAPQSVRPRRVTSAALAPLPGDPDDDEAAAFLTEGANIFADARGFADFAERLGAVDLPDLLEAAAAYCACVEGRPHFSRPHLMSHVAAVSDGGLSREDGLRGFGRLMRMGRIVKLKRGQFALTEDSRLLAEARKIAG